MKVISISGKARNGKDTFATILKGVLEDTGKRVAVVHYADLLKDMAKKLYQWDGEKDVKGRTLLQQVGTNCRKTDKDFFVKHLVSLINTLRFDFDVVLIPDTRYKNEIQGMANVYGPNHYAVRVKRLNFENDLTAEQKNHASETDLDTYAFPYKVEAKDLSDLKIAAMAMADELFPNESYRVTLTKIIDVTAKSPEEVKKKIEKDYPDHDIHIENKSCEDKSFRDFAKFMNMFIENDR